MRLWTIMLLVMIILNGTTTLLQAGGGSMDDYESDGGVTYSGIEQSDYELLPQDKGWAYNEELRDSLTKSVTGSWFRLDYLNWDIRRPKNTYFGEGVTGIIKPNLPFPAFDRTTAVGFLTQVPNFNDVSINNNNGMRASMGIAAGDGEVNGNIWFLGKNNQQVHYYDPYSYGGTIGISTLLNGATRTDGAVAIFDTSFNYRYMTTTMGAEINYQYGPSTHAEGLQFSPIVGVRYLKFDERVVAHGVDQHDPSTTRNFFLENNVNNDMLGPQIGLKTEFVHQYFTVGLNSKFLLGFNRIGYQVKSEQLFVPTDPFTNSEQDRNQVSPVVDLSAYGKFPFGEHFSLVAGYDVMWIGRVSRASNTFQLNDNGFGNDPSATSVEKLSDIFMYGVTVGGEFRF
jgi:hypothetical protein